MLQKYFIRYLIPQIPIIYIIQVMIPVTLDKIVHKIVCIDHTDTKMTMYESRALLSATGDGKWASYPHTHNTIWDILY